MFHGHSPRYGLDLDTARPGQILEGLHEVTVDPSWRTLWQSTFPASSRITASTEYARACSLDAAPLPYGLLLNLTLCLSVENFSHSCRLHLGLEEARREAPTRVGDSFRSYTRLDGMRNTSRGDASVILTTHILVNQRGDCVFSLRKRSYFDPIPALADREPAGANATLDAYFEDRNAKGSLRDHLGALRSLPSAPSYALRADQLILHPAVRPMGWSENLALTTLFRNTHPVHFDSQRHGREGIVVCGGFVQSMVFALADRELRQVLDEVLEHSSHVNTVSPEDRIGALSRILWVAPLDDRLETIRVKTLGLKNVDVERELLGVGIPESLLGDHKQKPSEIEEICRSACPVLENRIALQAVRTLIRPRA